MVVAVSNTAYGIIADAMRDAGLLAEGEDPNSEQLSVYLRRLCDLINFWQTQGLKLFLLEEYSVNLVAGTQAYPLAGTGVTPAKHLRVLQAYILDVSNSRRPINALSWNEWMRLPQTTGNDGA